MNKIFLTKSMVYVFGLVLQLVDALLAISILDGRVYISNKSLILIWIVVSISFVFCCKGILCYKGELGILCKLFMVYNTIIFMLFNVMIIMLWLYVAGSFKRHARCSQHCSIVSKYALLSMEQCQVSNGFARVLVSESLHENMSLAVTEPMFLRLQASAESAIDALWDAAEETRTIVAVAAFRALADMAEFDPHIDASRLDSRLAACVTDASASPAARVMAAQLCGERRVASQQPFGLVHEGNGWGFFGCGASSGGESGDGAMADVGLSCMVSGAAVAAGDDVHATMRSF